ncbi:MAG: glutathione S-transferase [Halieaceae bacterium]|jgi:glutathione S-transferase|nr:glutathione S-transferase [Halieaceae bacterium]
MADSATKQAAPVLYSFRRCPYAIRARMALAYADIPVELREVLLRDKPPEMLRCSPKGTVPVLVLPDGRVIDESLEVMRWALAQNDPERWMATADATALLVERNDGEFKAFLDRYKYADRYPEHSAHWYRDQNAGQLATLEQRLREQGWISGARSGFTDIALFPFIRQFAMVDRSWFDAAPYPALQRWLQYWLDSGLFARVMFKLPRWEAGQEARQVDWKAAPSA